MFAVTDIPRDRALRQTVDDVPTRAIHPVFDMLRQRLHQGKQLATDMLESGQDLIGLDVSQSFSYEKNHWPQLPDPQGIGYMSAKTTLLNG
jgi:hypothetical protein